ncbi:hypothetical protein IM792_15875 [Mucilaginibacter sp. JRF]|uniref:hypothetical protein n=1 Tax=Mucilaginibacter sp. JRF TaxID=2780088 RepID=UPI00187EEECA|nr:hypothetical protein [Mucilaginibacter sp. JRF]MBE9585933.1 hypothetical protein [Mucilaginibacter sp. JRF]
MKNYLIFTLSVLLFIIASCKKENPVQSKPTQAEATFLETNDVTPVPSGAYKVIAGSLNQSGFKDGNGKNALFNGLYGICVAKDGSLFVSDHYNNAIRKIRFDTVVTTLQIPKTRQGQTFEDPYDIAVADDGTIGVTTGDGLWIFWQSQVLFRYLTNFHESIDAIAKDAGGQYLWFTNIRALGYTQGSQVYEAKKPVGIGSEEYISDLATSANGKIYVSTNKNIYTLNANGTTSHILTSLNFQGISDIVVTKDGSKIYVVDGGLLKVITNCSGCLRVMKTIPLRGTDALSIALSNSEKYLYFTSSTYDTVNKLTL